MLFGVENLMWQFFLLQQLRNDFRIFNRGRTYQYRLTPVIAFANIFNRCLVFFSSGFVHTVELVFALIGAVVRHHHRFKPINFLEFIGLGISSASHACQLAIKAEIILEGDGCQRLVLRLDAHIFLGLDRLVQTITPTAPRHQAPGKLVNDDDFTFLHHVVLIAVIQVIGPQRCVEMVHQRDIGRIVKCGTLWNQLDIDKYAFRTLVALFGQKDLMTFFIKRKVTRFGNSLACARIGFAFLAGQ